MYHKVAQGVFGPFLAYNSVVWKGGPSMDLVTDYIVVIWMFPVVVQIVIPLFVFVLVSAIKLPLSSRKELRKIPEGEHALIS